MRNFSGKPSAVNLTAVIGSVDGAAKWMAGFLGGWVRGGARCTMWVSGAWVGGSGVWVGDQHRLHRSAQAFLSIHVTVTEAVTIM